MENLHTYLLTSGLALSLFYLVYWFCLKGQVYFVLNRILILLFLALAIFIPLMEFKSDVVSQVVPLDTLEVLTLTTPGVSKQIATSTFDWNIFLIIYILGVLVLSTRLIISLARLLYLYFWFPKVDFGGFKAIILEKNQSPFTFFNLLFISKEDYQEGENSEFLAHETVHRDHYHNFDLIMVELLIIIHWFNPFVWLFRKALVFEHEFLADQQVLKKGYDLLDYQKLLFEKNIGIKLDLANHFNHPPLKQRLKMMTVKKSLSVIDKVKYILSIPLICLMSMMLVINSTSFAQDKEVYYEVDELPQYKGGKSELYKFIGSNIKYPEIARKEGVEARVFISFVVSTEGKVSKVKPVKQKMLEHKMDELVVVGYDMDSKDHSENVHKSMEAITFEAIRVVKQLSTFKPGKKDGKIVNTKVIIPINFVLGNNKK